MKVVEKECYVPAKTYIDKTYVASDGKEFRLESDCLRYEKQLAIDNHPMYKTAIRNIDTFSVSVPGRWRRIPQPSVLQHR